MSQATLDDVLVAIDNLHETMLEIVAAIGTLEGTIMLHSPVQAR